MVFFHVYSGRGQRLTILGAAMIPLNHVRMLLIEGTSHSCKMDLKSEILQLSHLKVDLRACATLISVLP